MIKFAKILIGLAISFMVFQGCGKDDSDHVLSSEDSIYYAVNEIMHYWYLWNTEVPEIDYMGHNSPQDLMNALTIDIDEWSFVDKLETVNSYFNEGEDFGFGFYLGWDTEYPSPETNLRVLFVYNNTDAYTAGIRRGCIIREMNDVPVQEMTQAQFDAFFSTDAGTMKFDFVDNFGNNHTTTLSKEEYNMNAVLFSDTYNVSGNITGYMVFQSFLGYSKTEMEETIDLFKDAGITELIIDLRYNGGGYVTLAQELANIIVPESAVGETFFDKLYNDDRSSENDTTVKFMTDSRNLNLNRVFFITNQYSASASELVINGLEPHMDVIKIGERTYGKPVGMDGFLFQDWLIYPVTAISANAAGYSDYFNGLAPDKQVNDWHKYDWGDETEPALSQAFHYISFGNFDLSSIAKSTRSTGLINDKNFRKNNFIILDR